MRVNYLTGDYLPDESVLFEVLDKATPFAAAGAAAATAGKLSELHLNKEVCEALLDLDDIDPGAGLTLLLSASSLLSSPSDFLLDATSLGAKVGLKAAAAAAVTAAWYGMKYPILGGALGALGWCGPPAWLVALGAAGVVKSFDYAFSGVRAGARRRQACEAVRLACPLCVEVIEADGRVTASEAGFVRDLVRKSPLPHAASKAVFKQSAEEALETLAKASNSLRQDTMAHVILAAYADTVYHESEAETVRRMAERVGVGLEWIEAEAERVERDIRSMEVSGEAVFRASSYIAHRDGSLDDEETEMLTATLLSAVRDEGRRRELGEEARRDGTDIDLFTRKRIVRECRRELGAFGWLRKKTRVSDPDDVLIDDVLRQICLFVLAIGETPERRDALREVGHTLGVKEASCDSMFEKSRSRLRKVENKLQQVESGKCPECGASGTFALTHRRLLERDEYECRECGALVRRCVWPRCANMASAGDWWDDRLCPQCANKLLLRDDSDGAPADDGDALPPRSSEPLDVTDLIVPKELQKLGDQIRRWILVWDVDGTEDADRKQSKSAWVKQWRELFLKDPPDLNAEAIKERLSLCESKLHGGILLLELVNFTPYVPLVTSDSPTAQDEAEAKKLKKCELNEDIAFEVLGEVAHALGFARDYPRTLKSAFRKTAHALQGGWTRTIAYAAGGAVIIAIAGAIAATGIGAAIGGAMGLNGAAAMAAGLAFLGGGSVAGGGLGMAGGFAVIVMSGSLVGAGAGLGGKKLVESMTREAVLNEGAKMRVVMDEIVVRTHADIQIHQEVLRRQREAIVELHQEIDDKSIELARAKEAAEKDKQAIKELERRIGELGEMIDVMERSVKAGRDTLLSQVAC